jgi:hypothetical protein
MPYEIEKQNLDIIAGHLEKMNVPFALQDIGEGDTKFPALACTYRSADIDFDVIIYTINEWIHVKTLVVETGEMDVEKAFQLYEIALNLNYQLPETTFSAYNRKLYVEMDCLVNVPFEDFQSEFNSIAEGINAFVIEAKKIPGINLISTKNKKLSAVVQAKKQQSEK